MAKLSGGSTANRVEQLVRPTVEALGVILWDVVFEKEGQEWFLRILIDKEGGMDTDTCAAVSHAVDPILDEADPISQSYYLEVGSPGLGRKLTKDAHFEMLMGEKVSVKLFRAAENGLREFAGILKSKEGAEICVDVNGQDVVFAQNTASTIRLCDDENLFD